ncbi:hypothetical protein CK503_14680 [Aliifodinibius salipaludis]|uniref:DUF2914 domain-containing protein n=1 Tax=Fodinibius salipaludis TaxID=2032627 RepID=A0A2A2G6K3_9BACT|nr:DUF2914 domain-containing protein [Aliifodinibius salipaludis]PAU92928.1 hypothetical protein CK503_14680 [Aliifodinibius salipaludis]
MVSATKRFFIKQKRYAPLIFFIGGFIWDSLTLGRIDGWYSNTVLLFYLISLTACLYIYNLADDGRWENTFLAPYQEYAPLAVQFFLGGLSSAYVIFFFQSVTFTRTMVFFVILVILLLSNELLRDRISNKYLQFGAYFFVTFTFFTFFTPVLFGVMNTFLFILSGLISLLLTLTFINYIYNNSPSTQREISRFKISLIVIGIYATINIFYYFNLIPPVPLSLQNGIVAYNVEKQGNTFAVSYEQSALYDLWETYDKTFNYAPSDTVFVYTSIFAPTDLSKSVQHQWQRFSPVTEEWHTTDNISYEVIGGRKGGFRGYTFKENITSGKWRVNVTTVEGLVLGKIDFTIKPDSTFDKSQLTRKYFR